MLPSAFGKDSDSDDIGMTGLFIGSDLSPSLRGAKRRSNASVPTPRHGLLRFARNDDSSHTLIASTSTQRRSFQLCSAHSASCTPLAPSSSVYLYGAFSQTCRMNISHCSLKPLSYTTLSG